MTSLQNLCNISRKKRGMRSIFCRDEHHSLSTNSYHCFWWVWPSTPKVLRTTSMQCLCKWSRKNWVWKLMFCMLINIKGKLRVLALVSLARHAQITRINLQCLCDILRKKVRNEVRDLTALAFSNTTFTIYYTYNVLPPLTLFLSQYGIHTKPFLHLISCLCISLLFQITLGPNKLAC